MQKFWNFLFYITWVTLRDAAIEGINKPITRLGLWFFPKSKNKHRKKVEAHNKRYIQTEMKAENSSMVHRAFGFMLFTTVLILGMIVVSIVNVLGYSTQKHGVIGFMGVTGMAFLFNYILLYQKDIYLVYFKNFQKEDLSKKYYLLAILLHVVPFLWMWRMASF